jgi:ankyrin repeat protein
MKEGKASVNAKDKDGTNALMAAAVRGHKEVVEALVKGGADVNAQNADGHTALFFAYNGLNQVASLLDKYGEYIQGEDDNNTKIIQEALQTHNEVVALLLASGADETIKDKEGHTAADFNYKPAVEGEGVVGEGEAVKQEL